MEINLEEDSIETSYYYAEDGKTVGPFPLNELLPKITADTLVYREGIEWTNAKDVEELRGYFPEKEPKKPKSPLLLTIISVLLLALIGIGALIVYIQMNKQEPPKEEISDEEPGTSTGLPEATATGTAKPSSTAGTSGSSDISDPPKTNQPETKNSPSGKTSRVKQEDLFTCPNGYSILRTQVNDGICDCEDDPCSDETKN
jgi:hypothetical protein